MAEAVDEKQYYDVTKPESFVGEVFGRTFILPYRIQALLFSPYYGTAVQSVCPLGYYWSKWAYWDDF